MAITGRMSIEEERAGVQDIKRVYGRGFWLYFSLLELIAALKLKLVIVIVSKGKGGGFMRNRLTLMLLFIGIFFCSLRLFAEDRGYSEKELSQIRGMPDEELKRRRNYWEKKDREAEQKMIEPAEKMRKAEGELNRARRGDITVKNLITSPESVGNQEGRISRAQDKYDRAKEEWEKSAEEHGDAVYRKGVAEISLKEREKTRKNR